MYSFFVRLLRGIIILFSGLEVHGLENIPDQGGAVIVANHVSLLDPVVLGCSIKRPIHFMAKAELFKNPFLNWLFSKLYAFPVRRGVADREAIRTAIQRLELGNLLGVFPEGTRSKELQEIHNGAALFGLKANVPIIPVYMHNTDFLKFRRKISVYIGQPIIPKADAKTNKTELLAISNQIAEQFSLLNRKESP